MAATLPMARHGSSPGKSHLSVDDFGKGAKHADGSASLRSSSSQRQLKARARPVPRHRALEDEIIQDGLGSDELIPSEWATGSSAQFVHPNRSQSRQHNVYTHDAFALDASRALGRTGSNLNLYHQALDTSSSDAASSLRGSPINACRNGGPDASLHGGPSASPSADPEASLHQARERARRLAKAREAESSNILGSGESKANETANAHLQWDPVQTSPDVPPSSLRQDHDDFAPQATGKGYNRGTGVAGPSDEALRKSSRSVSQPNNMSKSKTGASPASVTKASSRRGNHATQTPKKSKSTSRLQESDSPGASTPQHILDEFGPLGGSPGDEKRIPGGSADEFGANGMRQASNPWDEEIIPTVKRRLEQERLLRARQEDDLIDTWDRDGLPLSKKSHVASPKRGGAKVADVSLWHGGGSDEEVEEEAEHPEETSTSDPLRQQQQQQQRRSASQQGEMQAQERIRRLTQALDMGFQEAPGGLVPPCDLWDQDNAATPAQQPQGVFKASENGARAGRSVAVEGGAGARRDASAPQKNASSRAKEDEGAGCCKCIVM